MLLLKFFQLKDSVQNCVVKTTVKLPVVVIVGTVRLKRSMLLSDLC